MGPGIADGFTEVGQLEPDGLIAGEFPRVSKYVTITGTGELRAGAVLGEIVADERYRLSASAATDGSQVPDAILAETIDLALGDVSARVYLTGQYTREALTLGTGHTMATVRRVLRQRQIFI
ncbi:MAG: head decoration protein [Agarilytica sp.]